MREIRVWFSKTGSARFISHLDLMRCMTRAARRAHLPLWYTQGFNSRVYMTFALPLSLGVSGLRESMDLRLEQDMPVEEITKRMNKVLPPDIRVLDVTEPKMRPGEIEFASYQIFLPSKKPQSLSQGIQELLQRQPLLVDKKSKHGVLQMDLHPELNRTQVSATPEGVCIHAVLPAGCNFNLNPHLLVNCIETYLKITLNAQIVRTDLYNAGMQPFI
ncbi:MULTISPECIES: TIGR03936 family radical SAM-associated protein [Caproicibacterium]|jgi:radical SAM-linked protein|nr:TIGR03936 family radical SAM-associated protein [Caproicibacterium lactatifermentans]MDD4807308.1 TIGR03936 family radical SAM-associated protein [Oscillospiraceae bacterium]